MDASQRSYSNMSGVNTSSMSARFGDSEIQDTDCILTTKASDQVRILLGQLVNSPNFISAKFNMSNSNYFGKHYDISMQKQFAIDAGLHQSVDELATSLASGMKDNHFEADGDETRMSQVNNPDQILNEDDVDEDMFVFPDREDKQAAILDQAEVQVALRSTDVLMAPFI